jgi:8-oxo-dGTP pyrophosphatase MutT (NUDIX family)
LSPDDGVKKLRKCLRTEPDESAQAAVAILIRENRDDLEFFLVKRAEVPGDPWSGDIAFPGGKKTREDKGLLYTAIREVREETNIHLENLPVLGYMNPVDSAVRRDIHVQPIVYLLDETPKVHLNFELTKYMWIPMKELRNSQNNAIVKGFDSPIYRAGGEVVWGLTYRMLEKLFSLIEDESKECS